MTQKEYEKLKKGNEVFPIQEMLKKFPESKGKRYFLISNPRKSNFPKPLSLKAKGFKSIERWCGDWFKIKK